MPPPDFENSMDLAAQVEKMYSQPYKERPPPEPVAVAQKGANGKPDFTQYKTNVAERLWRAKEEASKAKITASPDLVPLARDYQEWRKQMGLLTKYIDDYSMAMQNVSDKRDQLFKQYALLSEGTPLWDRVGKPLAQEQVDEVQKSGDLKTLEGIESRSKAIMKVAEDIGPGSLFSCNQLFLMQEDLNKIDYLNHNAHYITEWEEVVTEKLDADVRYVRELSRERDRYIRKVDSLRASVNRLEAKGRKAAPKRLTEQLVRNEKKLLECDERYEEKANQVSVVLFEATSRSWIDLYPVLKNVMKFEINRLGRESSAYGCFHRTLSALKNDYRLATKGTVDEPNAGSAL